MGRDVALQERFSGYGQVVQTIEIGFQMYSCRLALKASCEGDVSSGCAGCCHSGTTIAQFDGDAEAHTLLRWHAEDGDCGEDSEYFVDEAILSQVSHGLIAGTSAAATDDEPLLESPPPEPPLSGPEALQLLWRMLGAPFRWCRLCYPFATEETFYLLLRDVFIRCADHHFGDEEGQTEPGLFTCERSSKDDSDFNHDVAGLRQQLLGCGTPLRHA